MREYRHLLTPGKIGTLELRNRVVMAPIDSIIRTEDGGSNQEHRTYLAARAAGGVGLIVLDNVSVEWPRGSVGSKSLRIDQDRFIASLGDAVDAVHFHGAAIVAQINHSGRQTTLGGSQGIPLVSPSEIPWPGSGTTPRELSNEEVHHIIDLFVIAAERVKLAQFDGVEIHAAHGYLLSSFLSPALNQRSDEYGGSTRNRARVVTEIIGRIREELGADYPILIRFNCKDGLPGGLVPEEGAELGALFQAAGADALDISAGTYEAPALTFPPMMYPDAHLAEAIATIKAAVTIPVIGVGKIHEAALADELIASGTMDFVALGRALLADPDWVVKAADGREEDITPCIRCNVGCIHRIDQELSMKCNVNPYLGREALKPTGAASVRQEVVVVGGGPGGVEFALLAADRGQHVRLFEAQMGVGGQLLFAGIPEFKQDLRKLVAYYEVQLERSGIDVELGTTVTPELLEDLHPDLVALAMGGIPANPFVPTKGAPLQTYKEVLEGTAEVSGDVVVIGGGSTGCEVTLHLARTGHTVSVIEMQGEVAATEDPSIRQFYREEFERASIPVRLFTRVERVEAGSLVAFRSDTNDEVEIAFGTGVVAVGTLPERGLVASLDGLFRIVELGDCYRVASVLEATDRAARLVEMLWP